MEHSLVEHLLAKEDVASSSLVTRSPSQPEAENSSRVTRDDNGVGGRAQIRR
jgi:hypothetical protein